MARLKDQDILNQIKQLVKDSPRLADKTFTIEDYDGRVKRDQDVYRIKVTTSDGCSVSVAIRRPRPANKENIANSADNAAKLLATGLRGLTANKSKE